MFVSIWDAFINPKKYAVWVDIDRCFAEGPINEAKVWKILREYWAGKDFDPIVGVAEPFGDRIAIADGHHRFHAYKQAGLKKILVAVSNDFLYYPIVAKGINQLHPTWQTVIRKKLRSLKYKLTGNEKEDWGV